MTIDRQSVKRRSIMTKNKSNFSKFMLLWTGELISSIGGGLTSRVLYLLDGKICGEIKLGKALKGEERLREERFNSWLWEMGW